MSEYLLSVFVMPDGDSGVRLTVLPLTDHAEQLFPPVMTTRQALASVLSLVPPHSAQAALNTALSEGQPLQVTVGRETLHALLAALEMVRKQNHTPVQ